MLILANKQDVSGALNEAQLSQGLGLEQGALSSCSKRIVKCTALKGHNNDAIDPAMKMGLHWLITAVSESWSSINARVIADCESLDKDDARHRAETSRKFAQRKLDRRKTREADESIAKEQAAEEAKGGTTSGKPTYSEGVGIVKEYVTHGVRNFFLFFLKHIHIHLRI